MRLTRALLPFLLALSACDSGHVAKVAPAVSISPAETVMHPDQIRTFSVHHEDVPMHQFAWSVSSSSIRLLDYQGDSVRVKAVQASSAEAYLTATSQSDPSLLARAAIVVRELTVSISPSEALMQPGQVVNFTVHHDEVPDHQFVWTEDSPAITLLDLQGDQVRVLALQPSDLPVHLHAVSVQDASLRAEALIGVRDGVLPGWTRLEVPGQLFPGDQVGPKVLGADLARAGTELVLGQTVRGVHTLLAKLSEQGPLYFRELESGLPAEQQSVLLSIAAERDALDRLAAVYVALQPPTGNGRLLKLDADLRPVLTGWSPPDLDYRRGLVFDRGQLYAVHGSTPPLLVRLDPSGARIGSDAPLPYDWGLPPALLVDATGALYVTQAQRILRLTANFEVDPTYAIEIPFGTIGDAAFDTQNRLVLNTQDIIDLPLQSAHLRLYDAGGNLAGQADLYSYRTAAGEPATASYQIVRAVEAGRDGRWWVYDQRWPHPYLPDACGRLVLLGPDEGLHDPELLVLPRQALLGPGWERRFHAQRTGGGSGALVWECAAGTLAPGGEDAQWLRTGDVEGTYELRARSQGGGANASDSIAVVVREPSYEWASLATTSGNSATSVRSALAAGAGLFYYVGYLSSDGGDCIARRQWHAGGQWNPCAAGENTLVSDAFDADDGQAIVSLATGPSDEVYWVRCTAQGSTLRRADDAGAVEAFPLPFDFAFSGRIAVGEREQGGVEVYLVEEAFGSHLVWRFELPEGLPDGTPLVRPVLPHHDFGGDAPLDVALDPHGRLLYATAAEGRVCRLNRDGVLEQCMPTIPFADPIQQLAVATNGVCLVSTIDRERHSTIHWIDSTGIIRKEVSEYWSSGLQHPIGRVLGLAGRDDGRTAVLDDDGFGSSEPHSTLLLCYLP